MVTIELSLEYFSLVYFAAVGVVQAAAGRSGRESLFFFTRTIQGYVFAAVTITVSMIAFFTWNGRNATGVIEGSQQFFLFGLAVVSAIGVCFMVSYLSRAGTASPKRIGRSGGKPAGRSRYRANNYGRGGVK